MQPTQTDAAVVMQYHETSHATAETSGPRRIFESSVIESSAIKVIVSCRLTWNKDEYDVQYGVLT